MTNEQTLQLILKAIEKHPNDKGAYADLVTLSKIESNSADYVRSAKKILSQNMNKDMLETMRAIDIRLGRESFMEFLNALEIDRDWNSTFWPRRKKILEGKHHIASTINDFLIAPASEKYYLSMSFAPGTGKLLADGTPVLSKRGWTTHGELKVGDYVVGENNGEWVKVIAVHPKQMCDMVLTASNGEIFYTHSNHEWKMIESGVASLFTTKEMYNKRNDTFEFASQQKGKRTFVSDIKKLNHEHIQGNCITVEGGLYRIGKSMLLTHNSALGTMLSVYTMGKNHYARNFFVGNTSKIPKMAFARVKGILMENSEYNYRDIFYDFPFNTITWDNKDLTIRIDPLGKSAENGEKNDPLFSYVSVDSNFTGTTRASGDFEHGAGFCILDDIVKDSVQAQSPVAMSSLWDVYVNDIISRTLGVQSKILALGTLFGVNDPICKEMLINGDNPKYTFLRFPVEDEKGESNFDFGLPGEGYTKETIQMRREKQDPADFNCLYMAIPTHKQGRLFEIENLNLYNAVLPDEEPDQIVAVCDVAYGGKDSLSMPCAYVYGEDVYIHDVVFTKEDREKSQPQVVSLISKNKIQLAQFEANNGGDQYADKVSEILEIENVKCLVTSKRASTKMSKETRIAQYAPDIRKWHFLSIDYRSVQYQKFIDELCNFTVEGNNAHDDAPDSCGQLADFIFNRKTARKTQVTVGKRLF